MLVQRSVTYITGVVLLIFAYLVFKILQVLYRITFHPLARFPGPKLAAASRWYEVYYEVFVGGVWSDQISLLHEQYGPIVRIRPNEVHIDDSEYYDKIYNFNPHFDKRKFALDNLQFTSSYEQHKLRRHGFESFFSRATVTSLEGLIRDNLNKLGEQLNSAKTSGDPVNISLLYRCITADIITEYCFGRSYGFLDNPEAAKPFFGGLYDTFKSFYLIRESKVVERLMFWPVKLPDWCLPPRGSKTGNLLRFFQEIGNDTHEAMGRDPKAGERRTIFTELPRNEKLPPSEKTEDVILRNAVMLVSAGIETTTHALDTATLHLNLPENAHMLKRIKEEVKSAWPEGQAEVPSWKSLEALPYLQAVIKESLRLSIGAAARLPRINHHEAMQYKTWTMPAGTEISMTTRDIHFNTSIFPDPGRFEPDRWLGEEGKEREKYLVSFSKGSRTCIGKQ